VRYTNPVIFSDYSDPDVIRVGEDFFMVASSFNFVPGVPVLHSKNLTEWELINYVLPEIPFAGYERVNHGNGAEGTFEVIVGRLFKVLIFGVDD